MKILFYITFYPGYGGIEKVTTVLSNYLSANGIEVEILSFKNNTESLLEELSQDIKVSFMPDCKDFVSDTNRNFIHKFFSNKHFDWIIYQDCYSNIHELLLHHPDLLSRLIVVEHNSPCCHINSYKSYWKRLPWNTSGGFCRKILYPVKLFKLYNKASKRHKLLLSQCHKYVLLSQKLLPEIHHLAGKRYDKKITAINNPVTLPPETSPIDLSSKRKQMLFVGRLVEDKGINYLIQIWENIEKNDNEWNLVIVGDGPLRKLIENEISSRGLKRIQLAGAQNNVTPCYETSSILLMTSLFEGFPLVLFESMSRGCVPIAFNSFASLTDIIDDNINGFCITSFDTDEYATKLKIIMKDSKLLDNMARTAIKKSNQYTIERISEQWLKLLKE